MFHCLHIARASVLEPLAAEARKAGSWENFKHDFLIEIKHGLYWHFTYDPKFFIDPSKGPRDMSSIGGGEVDIGKFMVTSDLSYWASEYPERKYVALIDMSEVPRNTYRQVSRGMGNEFFVNDPSKCRVIRVYSRSGAMSRDREYTRSLPGSDGELHQFYTEVTGRKATLA